MGDLGRELDQLHGHPMPSHPPTELDALEARLAAFFAWAHGRPHPEIRNRFESDFPSSQALHDDVVTAIGEGRGTEVRGRLDVAVSDAETPPS